LETLGVDLSKVCREVGTITGGDGRTELPEINFTPCAERVIENTSVAIRVLTNLGVDPAQVRAQL
jgi:hypothetical protein